VTDTEPGSFRARTEEALCLPRDLCLCVIANGFVIIAACSQREVGVVTQGDIVRAADHARVSRAARHGDTNMHRRIA